MRLLLLAELRFLARAPWSAATAVLGVAIAVASIVAVHQIGTAVSRSLDAARPPHLSGITHVLERPGLTAEGYFQLRETWRAARWPAVAALVPIVEGYLLVDGRRTRVLGADWLAYPGEFSALEARAADTREGGGAADDATGAGTRTPPVWRLLDGAAVVADRQVRIDGALGAAVPSAGNEDRDLEIAPTDEARGAGRDLEIAPTDGARGAGHDQEIAPAGAAREAGRDRETARADARELAVGDRIAVAGMQLEVVGLVDGGLGPTLFADIATAQRLLGRDAEAVDYIGLAARDRWAGWRNALDALMPGFAAGLPEPQAPAELATAGFGARAIGSEQPAAEFARAILFNVGALGLLALLVAWFLVHQVALIWVERQRPVFARLHVLGVGHSALAAVFVGLFAVLGLVATLSGTVAGLWLAEVLVRLSTADAAGELLRGDPEPVLLLKAVCSGIGICVAGGWLAFRSDVRGAPDRFSSGSISSARAVAWPALTAICLVALFGGLFWEATGLLGGFAAILAVCALMIAAVRPFLVWIRSRLGRATARAGSMPRTRPALALLTRLAVREAVWRPEVVGVALAALALAVATSMGVGLMVESLRVDFSRMLETRLAGDLYLRGSPESVAAAADWLAAQPENPRVARQGETRVRVARGVARPARSTSAPAVTAHPGAATRSERISTGTPALLGYGTFDVREAARYGHGAALAPREVLVNERLARLLDVGAGDAVSVDGVGFVVAGVFQGFGDTEPRLTMDARGLAALGMPPTFDRLSITRGNEGGSAPTAPGVSPAGAPASLHALAAVLTERFPLLEVTERETLRARAFEVFDRTFAMTRALTLLALLVAGVGVYNALTALRLTQASTRRLLEAQGAGTRELGLVTLIRSATVGLLAVVVALPLGIAMAWMLCRVVNPRAFGWTIELHLVPAAWVAPLALGLVATVLAGMLPAPRERGGFDEGD